MAEDTAAILLQSLQRDINTIAEAGSGTTNPLPSLKKIYSTLFGSQKPSSQDLQVVFQALVRPVLTSLSHSRDSVRSMALEILNNAVIAVPDLTNALPFMIPVITVRIGLNPTQEPTEEIRCGLLQLITKLILAVGSTIGAYVEDLVNILCRAFADSSPDVKKEACTCVTELCKVAKVAVGRHNATLIKAMIPCCQHNHIAIRRGIILAMGPVVDSGANTVLDDMLPHIALLATDERPSVQQAVVKVVGEWLLTLVDRYSYQAKLLPFILLAMSSSEVPEVQSQAIAAMEEIGKLYEQENEERLRDTKNYGSMLEEETRGAPLPVPFAVRPRLGARMIVSDCVSKIIPPTLADMKSWTLGTRKSSTSLLCAIIFYAEANVTGQLAPMLATFYDVTDSDDTALRKRVQFAIELVGRFVPPKPYLSLILPAIQQSIASAPSRRVQMLAVLRYLIVGAVSRGLKEKRVTEIVNVLASGDIAQSEHTDLQLEAIRVVSQLLTTSPASCQHEAYNIFSILLQLEAIGNETVRQDARTVLLQLATATQVSDIPSLFTAHFPKVLSSINVRPEQWTKHSPQRFLFETLVIEGGSAALNYIQDVVNILSVCISAQSDPDVRISMIRILRSIAEIPDCQVALQPLSRVLLSQILIPVCVWKGGRGPAAAREAGMSCIKSVLASNIVDAQVLLSVLPELLPVLVTCMDDDYYPATRLCTVHVVAELIRIVGPSLSGEHVHTLYPNLVKRLDDSSDDIRLAVAVPLLRLLQNLGESTDSHATLIEFVTQSILIHLDDPSPAIQAAMLTVAEQACVVNGPVVTAQVDKAHTRHNSTQRCHCDRLRTLASQQTPMQQ